MTRHLIDVNAVTPQAWRNGGGQTRELWAWPSTGAWQVRISRADIDRDGAFSAFPGVQRWFAVLQGAGVELQWGDTLHTLHAGDPALCFDGAQAPGCRLLDGSTQDLNLMACGGDALMEQARTHAPWTVGHRMRGLYTTAAGVWRAGAHAQVLPAHSLLWDDAAAPGPWQFDTETAGLAWWLGFSPAE